MPQPTNLSNKSKKKIAASSGRIPAYNNEFAFRHNPKSKKTASILASPIQYCCRRCHEKLVWRKTYRKYKPLTQPTSCNLCKKRNITAAYHTVCDNCSVSHPKSLALLQEWNDSKTSRKSSNVASAAIGTTSSSESIDSGSDHIDDLTTAIQHTTTTVVGVDESLSQQLHQQQVHEDRLEDDDVKCPAPKTATSTRRGRLVRKRVCTVCFKQPALPDDDAENANDEDGWDDDNDKPLKLRQMKSIQRQREKQLQQKDDQRRGKKDPNADATVALENDNDFDDESENDDDDNEENDDDEQGNGNDATIVRCDDDHFDGSQQIPTGILDFTQDDDVDDPFLQAIGGVQNLLVGEAYQKKLLEKNTKRH